jgi:hypothetical protein
VIDAKAHPEMPLSVQKTLANIGDEYILTLQLGRTPIPAAIRTIGDFLSRNKFSETVLELGVSYFKKMKTFFFAPFVYLLSSVR